jgi:hypothetical protein
MKPRTIFSFMIFLVLSFVLQSAAQFTPEEIAKRPFWEDLLKTGKIISSEDIGEGVTKPKKLLLKKGDAETSAVWKRPGGTDSGMFDKWECEIAAYRMDKLLGLGLVPPTVERKYKMYSGSLQLWTDLPLSEKKMANENISVPADKLENYQKMRAIQRAFDSLIGNSDRTLQNLRYSQDWRLILIDHSRAFWDVYPYANRLLYGKNGIRNKEEFWPLPRAFVEKVRVLNYEMIRKAVEEYLTSSAINAVLVRQKLLLKEIDELIKEKGENAVLY